MIACVSFGLSTASIANAQAPCSFEGTALVRGISPENGETYDLHQRVRVVLRPDHAEVTGIAPLAFTARAPLEGVSFVLARPMLFQRLVAVRGGTTVLVHRAHRGAVRADVVGVEARVLGLNLACADLALDTLDGSPSGVLPQPTPTPAPPYRERHHVLASGLGSRETGPGLCGACGYYTPRRGLLTLHAAPNSRSARVRLQAEASDPPRFIVVHQGAARDWTLVRGDLGNEDASIVFGWVRTRDLLVTDGEFPGLGTVGSVRADATPPSARVGAAWLRVGTSVLTATNREWARTTEDLCVDRVVVPLGSANATTRLSQPIHGPTITIPADRVEWAAACPRLH